MKNRSFRPDPVEGRGGLYKVPPEALLKDALTENGKLKSYIDELEDIIKEKNKYISKKCKRIIVLKVDNDTETELHKFDWRKRSMPTHLERFNPPTFGAEIG